MKTYQVIITSIVFTFLVSGLIVLVAFQPHGTPVELFPRPTPGLLVIDIEGSVQKPGVYSLPPKSRVKDAVLAAGGFLSNADQTRTNLAALIQDGQKIQVVALGETPAPSITDGKPTSSTGKNKAQPSPQPSFPININTATSDELQNLPGIGPSKANAIVQYREQKGNFKNITDIQQVDGIGPTIYNQIKSLITTGN
jgi:competence protein ComEA